MFVLYPESQQSIIDYCQNNLPSILLWCGQQVAVLIPFLPAPALGALLGGIVLVFIIKLIRFIGGLF